MGRSVPMGKRLWSEGKVLLSAFPLLHPVKQYLTQYTGQLAEVQQHCATTLCLYVCDAFIQRHLSFMWECFQSEVKWRYSSRDIGGTTTITPGVPALKSNQNRHSDRLLHVWPNRPMNYEGTCVQMIAISSCVLGVQGVCQSRSP